MKITDSLAVGGLTLLTLSPAVADTITVNGHEVY